MRTKTKITYLGRRISTKNRITHVYTDENGERITFRKKLGLLAIGTIFECETEGDSYFGPYKPVGRVDYDISDLIARDHSETFLLKINNKYRKIPESEFSQSISVLKEIKRGLPHSQKGIFLAKIIKELGF